MALNGISTLTIPTGLTATSYTQASSYLVAVGTFNYDAYGAGFAIRKDGGAIDAYMAQVIALGAGTRNWTFVPGNGQPSFTRSMTQPDGTNESNDPSESGVDIWNVATAAGNLSGAGENQINISLIPNGTAFTIYATELGGGGGADKESRQTAKLDLAQAKREGRVVAVDGTITGAIDSTKPYYRARNVYDPDRLPTQYSGNTVVDNANAVGLLRARPWTAYDINPTANIVNEGGTLVVNIALLEILDGTTVYWSVSNSGDFGTALGTFVVNNDSGSFTVTPTKDLSTEGTETFNIILRRGSSSGTVVATFANVQIFDVSLTPTITPATNSVDEGSSLSFAVTNLGPNGTYYWTINHVTTANADFDAVNGSFSLTGGGAQDNGTGSFSLSTVADRTTEGAETFTVSVRSGSISGTVIVTSGSITVNDISLTPAFTVTPASIDEGASGSFTVNNLGAAGTYYYTINNITTANADFSSVSGSFNTATLNGNGTFTITTIADNTTEGAQTFTVSVRINSISGTILVTSGSVTINDTSLTASGDTPGLYKTTYTGYFADDPTWFATATPTTFGANPATSVQTTVIEEPNSEDGELFSVQWLGYFKPTTTETHTFFLNSDDASYMWIGATAVTGFTTANALINNGGAHAPVEVSASIALTAGVYYPVRIQFGEGGGGDELQFNYSTPTIVKTTTVTGKVFYNSATNGF